MNIKVYCRQSFWHIIIILFVLKYFFICLNVWVICQLPIPIGNNMSSSSSSSPYYYYYYIIVIACVQRRKQLQYSIFFSPLCTALIITITVVVIVVRGVYDYQGGSCFVSVSRPPNGFSLVPVSVPNRQPPLYTRVNRSPSEYNFFWNYFTEWGTKFGKFNIYFSRAFL